jgi:hypothetical protein
VLCQVFRKTFFTEPWLRTSSLRIHRRLLVFLRARGEQKNLAVIGVASCTRTAGSGRFVFCSGLLAGGILLA